MRAALSDAELARLLEDDAPCGDLTSEALGLTARSAPNGRLSFRARQPMTVCGTEEAVRLFQLAGASVRLLVPSGTQAAPGTELLNAMGEAASLHLAWKTAQTLMEWASGIASTANALVQAAATAACGRVVPVACTRKNVPGTKAMSVKAVKAGGATMHRLGLSETLLVFPEHRLFLSEPADQVVARLRATEPEKRIVVEVDSLELARRWALAGADVLQLEKFPPERVATCRTLLREIGLAPVLAVAGGVRPDNAADYVAAGADLLVSSAPYTAPPRDIQVDFSLC